MSLYTELDSQILNNTVNQTIFIVEKLISGLWTAMPVIVMGVDIEKLTVNIKPLIAQVNNIGEKIDVSVINNVPYIRVQGGKNAIIIDPQIDDIGLAIFCMRDISSFKATRGESLPSTYRSFSPSDAIYLGGLLNDAPERYVKITDEGVEIEGVDNVTINGENTKITAKDIIVETDSASVTAKDITVNTDSASVTAKSVSVETNTADIKAQTVNVQSLAAEITATNLTANIAAIANITALTINLTASAAMNITSPLLNILSPTFQVTGGVVTAQDFASGTVQGLTAFTHKHLSTAPGTPTGTPQV